MPDQEPVTGNILKQTLLICVILVSLTAGLISVWRHAELIIGSIGLIIAIFYTFEYGHAIGAKQ